MATEEHHRLHSAVLDKCPVVGRYSGSYEFDYLLLN